MSVNQEVLSIHPQINESVFSHKYRKDLSEIDRETLQNIRNKNIEEFCNFMAHEFDIAPKLPLRGLEYAVHLNPYYLKHLLSELYDNALDTLNGISDAEIILEAFIDEENNIQITLTDNGQGFSTSFLNNYEQGIIESSKTSSTQTIGGCGAGLKQTKAAISKQQGVFTLGNRDDGLQGAQISIVLQLDRMLTTETYKECLQLRKVNRRQYFQYGHTGFFKPPESLRINSNGPSAESVGRIKINVSGPATTPTY